MKASFRWTKNGLVANLEEVRKRAKPEFGRAQREETEIEVQECQRRCPIDMREEAPHPGLLRSTIHAEGPEVEGDVITTRIATKSIAWYGVFVHENLYAHHIVGEAKFIEGPLLESRPYMARRIASRVQLLRKG